MKMKKRYLFLATFVLLTSTAVNANCPDPSSIYYPKGGHGHWNSSDRTWESSGTGAHYKTPPKNPVIKFFEVSILTANGEKMLWDASPHVRCIYKISDYGLVILRQRETKYHWTTVNNQYKKWEYIPHEGDPNFGEWRCSNSLGSCSFSG